MLKTTDQELFVKWLGVDPPSSENTLQFWHVVADDDPDFSMILSVYINDDKTGYAVAEAVATIEPERPNGKAHNTSAFHLRASPVGRHLWLLERLSLYGIPVALRKNNLSAVLKTLMQFREAVKAAKAGQWPDIRPQHEATPTLGDLSAPDGPEPRRRRKRKRGGSDYNL